MDQRSPVLVGEEESQKVVTAYCMTEALAKARWKELHPLAKSVGINPMRYGYKRTLAKDIAYKVIFGVLFLEYRELRK